MYILSYKKYDVFVRPPLLSQTTTWRTLELAGRRPMLCAPAGGVEQAQAHAARVVQQVRVQPEGEGVVVHQRRHNQVRRRQLHVEEEEAVVVWRARRAHHCHPEQVHAVLEGSNVDGVCYRFSSGTNTMSRPKHNTKKHGPGVARPGASAVLGHNFNPQCRHGYDTANRLARRWPDYFHHLLL